MGPNFEQLLSRGSVEYSIHHIFLPPKLPQDNDLCPEKENFLISLVCRALSSFNLKVRDEQCGSVQEVHETLKQLARTLDSGLCINQRLLNHALDDLAVQGGTLPVYVKAQNAGLIISRRGQRIFFESFELTPTNVEITTCNGRLRREFPAAAVAIPIEMFEEDGFRQCLAQTIAKTSSQEIANTCTISVKAGNKHKEIRDTTHPKIVTDYFMAVLDALGDQIQVETICKYTREEVLWSDSLLPWHRSSLWLMLRVVLDLGFRRHRPALTDSIGLYKAFMVYMLADVLSLSLEHDFDSSVYQYMIAKISQRLMKLELEDSSFDALPWILDVRERLVAASTIVGNRWKQIQTQFQPGINLSMLKELEPFEDITIKLPKVDEFVKSIAFRKHEKLASNFVPSAFHYMEVDAQPPLGFEQCANEYQLPALAAFETWVQTCLEDWVERQGHRGSTIFGLSNMIQQYHRSALLLYSQNPELFSVMVLTILHLWVACDKLAVQKHPMLMEFDHEIQYEVLQSLILPFKEQLKTLYLLEKYLKKRRLESKTGSPSVFRDFGDSQSFAVKYFDQSDSLKALHRELEAQAAVKKAAKCAELRQKQEIYKNLLQKYEQALCNYKSVFVDEDGGFFEDRHSSNCQRCRYHSEAMNITIGIYEWPLSPNNACAKATVFELEVPSMFRGWRSTTFYLLREVLLFTHSEANDPDKNIRFRLQDDVSLHTYFQSGRPSNNFIDVVSAIKPNIGSHYRAKNISSNPKDADVCVNNGLVYQYRDRKLDTFVGTFLESAQFHDHCTYILPSRSVALRKFLARPHFLPNGCQPNEVLSSLSECPEHMSVDEFRAFASLPLGYSIQWHNILVQLAMPSLDFAKQDTCIMLSQIIWQAGPPGGNEYCRAAHEILAEEKFAERLLSQLYLNLAKIKENWKSQWTLLSLTQLATRCLSFLASAESRIKYLEFLEHARNIAYTWFGNLRNRMKASVNHDYRQEILLQLVEIGLICTYTLNIEPSLVGSAIQSSRAALMYLHCSMTIQENSIIIDGRDLFTTILYQRWKRNSLALSKALADMVVSQGHSCLDEAIGCYWPGYCSPNNWQKVDEPCSHWLQTSIALQSDVVEVQFNLLTCELLVDGLPLSRLPSSYEKHETYSALFGTYSLEVMPALLDGMAFTAKEPWSEFNVSLRLQLAHSNSFGVQDEFLITAQRDRNRYDLISRSHFRGFLPHALVEQSMHWYHHESRSIILTPLEQPWSLSSPVWQLCRSGDGWCAETNDLLLVDPASKTACAVSKIFSQLEDPLHIHILVQRYRTPVVINIPRLQLRFLFEPGTSSVESCEFRNHIIDVDQETGTFIGMISKLVLRKARSDERLILVPNSKLSFTKSWGHVSVRAERGIAKVLPFRIDRQLGRLVDNGSLESKLIAAYIHALSSYCLPDPLTQCTGTEQAIRILQSAGVRSFPRFQRSHLDILERIARLAPARRFYPQHLQVMQQVEWNKSLDFLAQDSLLIPPVQSIFEQLKESKMFYEQSFVDPPKLDFVNPSLLRKELHRSSLYRTNDFGRSQFDAANDVQYVSRDRAKRSSNCRRAYDITRYVQRNNPFLFPQACHDLRHVLWSSLEKHSPIRGPGNRKPQLNLRFDAEWFEHPLDSLGPNWCSMVESIRDMRKKKDKFTFIFWISSVAFAEGIDWSIVQLLAAYYMISAICDTPLPQADHFQLKSGSEPQTIVLRNTISDARRNLSDSPEAGLTSSTYESQRQLAKRKQRVYNQNLKSAMDRFVSYLSDQWPCETPSKPQHDQSLMQYVNVDRAMNKIRKDFQTWRANLMFKNYLDSIHRIIDICTVQPFASHGCILKLSKSSNLARKRCIDIKDMFNSVEHTHLPDPPQRVDDLLVVRDELKRPNSQLKDLVAKLKKESQRQYEAEYANDLYCSMNILNSCVTPASSLKHSTGQTKKILNHYLESCLAYAEDILSVIKDHITSRPLMKLLHTVSQSSRISRIDLLQCLLPAKELRLSRHWKERIVAYGLALTEIQRARRLLQYEPTTPEFKAEFLNVGHTNWFASQFPEHLLLEIEAGIMIRERQEEVAALMRYPPNNSNTTMQMNMGEGKSSVIVPIIVLPLADSTTLVRVTTGRPQAKQMFSMLLSKIGGILDRRIYHLPFSRDIILDKCKAERVRKIAEECKKNRGVLLVQPEHILSLKLMSIERLLSGDVLVGEHLLETLRMLDRARDVVDECDENFSVKFELVYTIGIPQPVDFSPQRWLIVLEVLDLFRKAAVEVQSIRTDAIQLGGHNIDQYPKIKILKPDVSMLINQHIARSICQYGFVGFPIAQQPEVTRKAAFKYMTEPDLVDEYATRLQQQMGSFWIESKKQSLLLIRGLLAGGILAFAFGLKRWRVDYGLDPQRVPSTKLAIPFRAKDNPSPRSEFSHPEVILVLTALSYLYGGMPDDDIFIAIDCLFKSDQPDSIYRNWVSTAHKLPKAFRQLSGVNRKDRQQCKMELFPQLRYSKGLIDFYLSQVVFPRQMREFPSKLSASGWDIGEPKDSLVTGFSGTNDSRQLLPLGMTYLDSPRQKHTNALVLDWILNDRNSVYLIDSRISPTKSETEHIVTTITELQPRVRVILDVGAQLLELDNFHVAKLWLKLMGQSEDVEAVVFFDESDELTVLDRTHRCEPLQSSPYIEKMDCCLVYLDEIHTRGTDLVLPSDYRAAVTLGAGLTKDRLVQACMRMRKLATSQSVVFCVPSDIACKIRAHRTDIFDQPISVSDVISWSITETLSDLRRNVALWGVQGRCHAKRKLIWDNARTDLSFNMSLVDAEKFLEQEALSLSERYVASGKTSEVTTDKSEDANSMDRIEDRLLHFGSNSLSAVALHEEQERELSPEVEQERQVERPKPASAERNFLHADVRSFVRTGELNEASEAFLSAFDILQQTSAAATYKALTFPKGVLVTKDFATTIRLRTTSDQMDSYQRPVQWVVTKSNPEGSKVENLLIISPYEAYQLLPAVRENLKVTLHIYSPCLTEENTCLDHLNLYTEGRIFQRINLLDPLLIQLNLFAGQLYFESYLSYSSTCSYLGLQWKLSEEEISVDGDGFIIDGARQGAFDQSPIEVLKVLACKIRRHGLDITRTHLGKMLGGIILDGTSFGLTGMRDLQGDVAEDHKSEKLDFIASR